MEAWIETVKDEDASGLLGALYEAGIKRAGRVFNIIRIMSLRPQQIRDSMKLYETLMFGPSGLGRGEREMVATVVSHANDCYY